MELKRIPGKVKYKASLPAERTAPSRYELFTVHGVFRALGVIGPPVEVELEDLIVCAQLASTKDTLGSSKWGNSVKLLK